MGPFLLFLTTLIWGTAFLAQKIGGESLGPLTITCFRSILGGCFLLGVIACRHLAHRAPTASVKKSVRAGILCGLPLFFAITTQQIGIADTTPGISAFLTANYVLIVPILASILARRRPAFAVVACALVAVIGTYLICVSGEGFGIGKGELWTLLCAVLFSIQVIAVDRLIRSSDGLIFSAAQLFTCAVLGLVCFALPSERHLLSALPSSDSLMRAVGSLFYVGVLSSGIAYTLQNFGQARTPPALAAIVMSFESVVGAVAGYFILGDALSPVQIAGCVLVFSAILFASAKG